MADIFPSPKKEPPVQNKQKLDSRLVRKKRKTASSKKSRSPQLKKIRREVYRLLGKRGNQISAFVPRPNGFCFENQMDKEEIILLLRRHWITNLHWIIISGLMFLFPAFLRGLPPFTFLPMRFNVVIGMMWYLFIFAFILEQFFTWFFGVNIITDERIIDVDFVSLIHKRVSEAEIENIQDVTYKMGGFLGTVLNFGTIYIQTAAERPEFEFEQVSKPALVVKVLKKMRIEEKQEALEGRIS